MQLSEVTDLLRSTEWAEDRTEEMIRKSMENSCPYGLFLKAGTGEGRIKESSMAGKDRQIGFARVLTDGVTTFYLMDFVIEEKVPQSGIRNHFDGSDHEREWAPCMECCIQKMQKPFMKNMASVQSEIQREQKKYIWKNRAVENSCTVFLQIFQIDITRCFHMFQCNLIDA